MKRFLSGLVVGLIAVPAYLVAEWWIWKLRRYAEYLRARDETVEG